ncbi:MAG: LysR family transcriptional regulator [Rhodobacteraceae bacterium]|nr:LysR family transcriptional regulator [Paracoccaceae bacterium]
MLRLDALTLKQLRALTAVAEHGSITAAAQALSLTAPAVHTQLKSLETALDAPVLSRGGSGHGGAQLTAEGQAVLRAARSVEVALTSCAEQVRALRHGQRGLVVLGVVSTGKYFAPALVKRLRDALPDVDVILKVGNRGWMIEALQDRSVELAIMGRPPRQPSVAATPLGEHPHVIIAPPDHPLAQGVVDPARFLDETFVVREEGSGTRILMTRYLGGIGDETPVRMLEMGSNETIKQAVMAGLGIALISQHTVTEELRSGRLVSLCAPGLPIKRQWYLIHREDQILTPVMSAVFDFIVSRRSELLPRDIPSVR